jgi:hypothetical protein
LLTYRHQAVCFSLAALTGAAFASSGPAPVVPAPAIIASALAAPAAVPDSEEAVARALCSLKTRIGARRTRWTPARCTELAAAVMASASRHQLSPALLLAVMIQESDLDENAARLSHGKTGPARDSGLMGIRCVLGRGGRCTNALVRGLTWRQVMQPHTNIELGARYLAHYRAAGGCRHRDHAYWAHYNHGTRYIAHGRARLYPRHVAALYTALGETLGLDLSELTRVKTVVSVDERARRLVTVVERLES